LLFAYLFSVSKGGRAGLISKSQLLYVLSFEVFVLHPVSLRQ